MDTLAVQLYISHYLGMFRTFTCESAPMARKRNVRRRAHFIKKNAWYVPDDLLFDYSRSPVESRKVSLGISDVVKP